MLRIRLESRGVGHNLRAFWQRGPARLIRMLGAVFMAVILAAFLASCASVPERNPLPAAASETVVIPGIRWARIWGDELPSDWDQQLAERKASLQAQQAEVPQRPPTLLAISGGGANGALPFTPTSRQRTS